MHLININIVIVRLLLLNYYYEYEGVAIANYIVPTLAALQLRPQQHPNFLRAVVLRVRQREAA